MMTIMVMMMMDDNDQDDEEDNDDDEAKTWTVSVTRGQNRTNTKRVGSATSAKLPSICAWAKRTKADTGFSKKSTSATRILATSAAGGIFFWNARFLFFYVAVSFIQFFVHFQSCY